ncbi:MAG TPA: hypothetical protein VFV52_00845 [Bacilli bacterium]|nr:hypothetical protein [Bacilli bacterium]
MNRYHVGNCKQYIGQGVMMQTQNGMRQGLVHKVDKKGIYLKPMGGGQQMSGAYLSDAVTAERNQDELRVMEAYYGRGYGRYGYWNPAWWFVPFLTILALFPLFFW